MNEPQLATDSVRLPPATPRDRRRAAWRWIGALLGLGLVPVALMKLDGPSGFWEYVRVGLVYGTLLGQTTLAAAWAVLGTGLLVRRLLLSILWVLAIVAAIAINVLIYVGPQEAALISVVLGTVLLGQWLVAQVPLWGLAIGYDVRLSNQGEAAGDPTGRARQFGIRQLMVVTAVVAVVLGIGRGVVQWLMATDTFLHDAGQGILMIGFLAAAGVVMTLPLVLAMFLHRGTVLATATILVLMGLATLAEMQLLATISGVTVGGGPDVFHLASINGMQAAWVLAITALLRRGGNRLTTGRAEDDGQGPPRSPIDV